MVILQHHGAPPLTLLRTPLISVLSPSLLLSVMAKKPNTKHSSITVDDETLKTLILKFKETSKVVQDGCWRSNYALNGRGHVQIKYKGTKYLGHRIMACARGPGPHTYVAYSEVTKIQASHICGKPWCINPDHLFMENDLINQTRDCCRMYGKVRWDYLCPHIPTCIGCNPCNNEPITVELDDDDDAKDAD